MLSLASLGTSIGTMTPPTSPRGCDNIATDLRDDNVDVDLQISPHGYLRDASYVPQFSFLLNAERARRALSHSDTDGDTDGDTISADADWALSQSVSADIAQTQMSISSSTTSG